MRNAFVDDSSSFIDQCTNQPIDNFLVTDFPPLDIEVRRRLLDDLVNFRTGRRLVVFIVGIEAGTRFLTMPVRLNEHIGHMVGRWVSLLFIAQRLPRLVPDVETCKIEYP